MIKLPISPTPKQFKAAQKLKNEKTLTRFLIEINNDLKKGISRVFRLPTDTYIGFMVDVRNHFGEYGWESELFADGIFLKEIKDN